MKLTRRARRPAGVELNMAPMIDVVFLLLIFFMCTSSFIQAEGEIPSNLPETGVGQADQQDDFNPVRIDLLRSGEAVMITCNGHPCGSFEVLRTMLREQRLIADTPVIIQGAGDVPFGYMVAALDACHQEQLKRVVFSAGGN